MSSIYTPVAAVPPASYTIPSEGDKIRAASVNPVFEDMADTIKYLFSSRYTVKTFTATTNGTAGLQYSFTTTSYVTGPSLVLGSLNVDDAIIIVARAQAKVLAGGYVGTARLALKYGAAAETLLGATEVKINNTLWQHFTVASLPLATSTDSLQILLQGKVAGGGETMEFHDATGIYAVVFTKVWP